MFIEVAEGRDNMKQQIEIVKAILTRTAKEWGVKA